MTLMQESQKLCTKSSILAERKQKTYCSVYLKDFVNPE
jgi:hypothetical protein